MSLKRTFDCGGQVSEHDTSCRAHAAEPSDVIALDGMLELPQAFGSINLGEVTPIQTWATELSSPTVQVLDMAFAPFAS